MLYSSKALQTTRLPIYLCVPLWIWCAVVALTACGSSSASSNPRAASDTPSEIAGWQNVLSPWEQRKIHHDVWLWLDGAWDEKVYIRAVLHRDPELEELERYRKLGLRRIERFLWAAPMDRLQALRIVKEPAVHRIELDMGVPIQTADSPHN
ncbi:MAG: hypothetical protein AAF355_03600 [Myxococcota bacterium]